MGQQGRNTVAAGFTRVAIGVLGAATLLGGLIGYLAARVILRGD
jgi:hypothetical protein